MTLTNNAQIGRNDERNDERKKYGRSHARRRENNGNRQPEVKEYDA